MLAPWKKNYNKPRQHTKNQRHHFANKGPSSQSFGFFQYTYGWELDHKDGWALKNWCFQTVVLEKILESPLDCKEIKPVSPQLNQSWIFIRRTDAEVEASILWPSDAKSQLTGKTKQNKKNPWYWESLRAGGEGGSGGRDGWIASLTQWTWVWVNSGKCWWTGRLGVLQFMGLQRIRHDWATEQNWTECEKGLHWWWQW